MGSRTTFDYTGLNTSTGNGVTRVTDPDGNKTVYSYSQGARTAQSAWTGTTLSSEQDFRPGARWCFGDSGCFRHGVQNTDLT